VTQRSSAATEDEHSHAVADACGVVYWPGYVSLTIMGVFRVEDASTNTRCTAAAVSENRQNTSVSKSRAVRTVSGVWYCSSQVS